MFLFSILCLFFCFTFLMPVSLYSVFVDTDRHVVLITFQGHIRWQLELTRDELLLLLLSVVESMRLFFIYFALVCNVHSSPKPFFPSLWGLMDRLYIAWSTKICNSFISGKFVENKNLGSYAFSNKVSSSSFVCLYSLNKITHA